MQLIARLCTNKHPLLKNSAFTGSQVKEISHIFTVKINTSSVTFYVTREKLEESVLFTVLRVFLFLALTSFQISGIVTFAGSITRHQTGTLGN